MRILDRLRSVESNNYSDRSMMPAFKYALEAQNIVTTDADGNRILDCLSLQVTPRQTIVLATKETSERASILDVLSGDAQPERGRLLIEGQQFKAELVTSCDFVNSRPNLDPLEGNFDRRRKLYRRTNALTESGFYEALTSRRHKDEIKSLADFEPPLSRVELRQLNLANCLLEDNEVWILVDPFIGLDDSERKSFCSTLLSSTKTRTTIIVSNDLAIARQANQVLTIEHGKLVPLSGKTALHPVKPSNGESTERSEANGLLRRLEVMHDKDPLNDLIYRSKLSGNEHYSTWLAWDRSRLEPVLVRKANTETGTSQIQAERQRLNLASSVNSVRALPSGPPELSVLEFVSLTNLSDLIDKPDTITLRLIYCIGADIANALASYHAAGIVHGEIQMDTISKRGNLWVVNSSMPTEADLTWRNDVSDLAGVLTQLLGIYLRRPDRADTSDLSRILKLMQSDKDLHRPPARAVAVLLRNHPRFSLSTQNTKHDPWTH